MFSQRMVRQAFRLGLAVTLVVLALSGYGGGVGDDSPGEAATMKTVAGDGGTPTKVVDSVEWRRLPVLR
jgi:hypothetical protein